MKTITKFLNGRKYYPSEKRILFQILERNGKELKVAHICQNDTEHFLDVPPYNLSYYRKEQNLVTTSLRIVRALKKWK